MLKEMQARLAAQEAELSDLRRQIAETPAAESEISALVKQEVDAAIEAAAFAQTKDVDPLLQLSKHITKLKLKGDLRLRYERQERDKGESDDVEETRDRFRTRFRLGATFVTNENWEIGFGLATGGADATSTNDTWSDKAVFETGDIRLDYAYAKHTWSSEGLDITLTLGQQKNPFVSSFLLWDGDIRPIGATVQAKSGGVFGTLGWYDVYNLGRDEADVMMLAAQLGYEGNITEDTKFLIAAAYYILNDPATNRYFTNEDGGGSLPFPGDDSDEEEWVVDDDFDPDYNFEIFDVYGEVSTKLGDIGLTVFGEWWKNLGVEGEKSQMYLSGDGFEETDPESNDVGYCFGVAAKIDRFKLSYAFGHVESDSVYAGFKDSDFGDTAGLTPTDVEGHKFGLEYKVTKNFSVAGTYMNLESIDNMYDRDGELYQIDLKYKF